MKEEEYLRELSNGNIAALEKLYILMKTTVYAVALAIVRNRSIAEDIVQETFVKVYMKIDKYIPNTNPKAWIITIARNLSYDSLRNQNGIITSADFDGNYMLDGAEKQDLGLDEIVLTRLELTEELFKLSEIERQVVVLHVVAGLKHSEISKILNIPEGTVRWKYSITLKKLAERLGGNENEAGKVYRNCISYKK
jgi:RNA polymerase sigma-70 factor (ECF subfamily)